MRTIGLIGGMSWKSTIDYYRYINQESNAILGGLHSAPVLLHSFDFGPIADMQHADDWSGLDVAILGAAKGLEAAGAEIMLICTNTMHRCAPVLAGFELVHIVDSLTDAIVDADIDHVGLLGTTFTMGDDDYRGRLEAAGINVSVPDADGQEEMDDMIYGRLTRGVVDLDDRETLRGIIASLVDDGVDGVILGCTELPLLVAAGDVDITLFDSTRIHAHAAVAAAMRTD